MRELGAERYCVEQILRIVIERAEKLAPVGARHASATRCAMSRWMVVYLTRLYAQGESPHLAL